VSVDLPLRRHVIQTPQLNEKEALADSASQATEDQRLKLVAEYDTARAMLDAALARVRLIERERLPLARREAESSIAGFARDQDLVREARMRYIEAEFDLTSARLDAWRALADLDYLLGEDAS
jgi:multidrug efflux pump subunit AcrA (membrane-fusion protein)